MTSKVVPAVKCIGCGRPMLNLKDVRDYESIGDQEAEELSEAIYKQVKIVLPCAYDDSMCARCYNDPETREFFECCVCKKSLPNKQLAFVASDEECCNDEDATVRVCDTCVTTITAAQLIAQLQSVRLINATNDLESDNLYRVYMGAKKMAVPKKSK